MTETEEILPDFDFDEIAEPTSSEDAGSAVSYNDAPGRSFWRKLLGWDFFVTVFSVFGLGFGALIWYQPPLIRSSSPKVSCSYLGANIEGVELYRPLSMPSRYYIKLPHELRKRYRWFSVDRRREICAIAKPPTRTFMGMPIIRRGDSLGLDLEFRHLDGSEWRIGFFEDSIVFSNALLSVRLEQKQEAPNER